MHVATVTTADRSLLSAIRETVAMGDDVLLCVAFVATSGVQLIRKELAGARRARLLVTTVFGSTSSAALALAASEAVEVRVMNPSSGTYHPKLYLGRAGDRAGAVIGSANLTAGLVVNTEAATHLRGKPTDDAIRDARAWAEAQWDHGEPLARGYEEASDEIEPELLAAIRAEHVVNPVFLTLRRSQRNLVREVSPSALYVETERSRVRHARPEPVPAWMLNLAWEVLRRRGRLTNKELLDELRVHRSSAVLAILARLPGVDALPGTAMGVRIAAADHGRDRGPVV
jgi:HKD family nuclease